MGGMGREEGGRIAPTAKKGNLLLRGTEPAPLLICGWACGGALAFPPLISRSWNLSQNSMVCLPSLSFSRLNKEISLLSLHFTTYWGSCHLVVEPPLLTPWTLTVQLPYPRLTLATPDSTAEK